MRLYIKMEEKFRGYRISSARLPYYDYSLPGYYFITICTQNMVHFLGNVLDGEMKLSLIGKIVADEWENTEKIRSNVKIDEWVVMPNHLHGIIFIKNDDLIADSGRCVDGRIAMRLYGEMRLVRNQIIWLQ